MKPIKSSEIMPGIFSVRNGFVNFYAVKGTQGYIVIDTGMHRWLAASGLKKFNIAPADVLAVFLTHTDYDHVGGIKAFGRAIIYLPKSEQQMINGSIRRNLLLKNRLSRQYTVLADGESIDIDGLHVQCMFTPGHTKGSASYIVNSTSLFAGDNISLKRGKAGIFSRFINMDSKTQADSIRKMAKLKGIKAVFTAHYGYTGDFDAAFANWK